MQKLIITLALLLPLGIFAQSVPGFMGKRMQVGYEGHMFPSFKNVNSEELPADGDIPTSLNFQHHFHFDYTLSKKWAISVKPGFISTYAEPADYYSSSSFTSNIKVSATAFTLGFKKFRQHFAPLGGYVEYRLSMLQVKAHDFSYPAGTASGNPYPAGTVTGSSAPVYSAGFGFGLNRSVFDDQLMLTVGLDFNYAFVSVESARTYFDDSVAEAVELGNGNSLSNQNALLNIAKGRIFIHNLLNFKVGVSYLL